MTNGDVHEYFVQSPYRTDRLKSIFKSVGLALYSCVVSLSLTGCSLGERTHLAYKMVMSTPEHKSLVADPKSLVGKYYKVESSIDFVGSESFDDALEDQHADQMPRDQYLAKYTKKENFDAFRATHILLNEGMNDEDAKADLLLKVIDGKSCGPDKTAVQTLVLNKKFAGRKEWVGSLAFLTFARPTDCPIADPNKLEFATSDTVKKPAAKRHKPR